MVKNRLRILEKKMNKKSKSNTINLEKIGNDYVIRSFYFNEITDVLFSEIYDYFEFKKIDNHYVLIFDNSYRSVLGITHNINDADNRLYSLALKKAEKKAKEYKKNLVNLAEEQRK